ncbi:unnamed protein product [Paramecium pentaurelia]|uniref:Uncharacterized protein n=1 Tax=Paramecium pentaurelia TaxID=43138 RepID=A0A8S1WTL1_9CILI|nr:unnamed protein product [Paramecium pentaurelia]
MYVCLCNNRVCYIFGNNFFRISHKYGNLANNFARDMHYVDRLLHLQFSTNSVVQYFFNCFIIIIIHTLLQQLCKRSSSKINSDNFVLSFIWTYNYNNKHFYGNKFFRRSCMDDLGKTLLIILMFTIFGCVKQSEITWKSIYQSIFIIGAIIIVGTTIPIMIILILIDTSVVWQKIVGAVIVITYGFYLILDTKFMMNKGRINLENEFWRGSLLLSGLMFQPLVRIIEYLFDIFKNRNR